MSSNSSVNKNQDIIAYILLILTMIIWGGTWPLGRWLVAKDVGGETIPPLMIATIRYFLAIICFFLILKYKERNLEPKPAEGSTDLAKSRVERRKKRRGW